MSAAPLVPPAAAVNRSTTPTPLHPPAAVRPTLSLPVVYQLFVATVESWMRHRAPKMGAALAYYTAVSLAPLLVLILTLASLLVQRDVARETILRQVNDLIGSKGGEVIREIFAHAQSPSTFSWQTILSLGLLLVSASGAFGELQDSLNQIWEVPPQKRSIWLVLRDRALPFAMVFMLGFLMIVSLVLSAMIAGFSQFVVHTVPVIGLEVINGLVTLLVVSALFTVIFRILPDVELTWRDVWPGALVAGLLFSIGKIVLGWYLGRSAFSSGYGAAGSFMILLVWVFYTAQIVFFGAEFSRAYTLRFNRHPAQTAAGAEPIATAQTEPPKEPAQP